MDQLDQGKHGKYEISSKGSYKSISTMYIWL